MNHTILIVDDSPFIVEGLAAILKRKGYNTLTAHGGDECLVLLQTVVPDLVLLDIMMEPMDGWETLDHIKSNPTTKEIPVLMFSAKKITPAEAEEHSINIENFVSKPVSPAQLLESIQKIFSRKNDLKMEELAAQNAGLDRSLIEEHSTIRKRIEIDRNMLAVIKSSVGMDIPGREISHEEKEAIRKLEDKIHGDERRLKEIDEKFSKTG
ncbi:MAG: response regulator [Methanoregula sp.]|nr:response regulator [Methanoregula sp.]